MHDRAMQAVFWLGMYRDLEITRNNCTYCNKSAPSQAALPPHPLLMPDFPFQMIVMDYCTIKGKTWLVCADRFSGWVSCFYYPREATATDLVKTMKEYFSTYGVAEHISSDSGVQFTSQQFQTFLKAWGTDLHKISSSYNPHSNLRAESAIKTSKRIITDNTKSDGSPIWDKLYRAILQHRNTPLDGIQLSPAQLLMGRPIRDFQPVRPGQFQPSEVWVDNAEKRELAMKKRFCLARERWSLNTRALQPLQVGQKVLIQNQSGAGKGAKRWDKTGTVVEDKGFDKYSIKVDGSNRVTDRNRRYLRYFKPDSLPIQYQGLAPQQEDQAPGHVEGPDNDDWVQQSPVEDGLDTHDNVGNLDPTLQPDLSVPTPPTPMSPLPTPPTQPQPTEPRRPTRTRVPNSRYPPEEFDLTR